MVGLRIDLNLLTLLTPKNMASPQATEIVAVKVNPVPSAKALPANKYAETLGSMAALLGLANIF